MRLLIARPAVRSCYSPIMSIFASLQHHPSILPLSELILLLLTMSSISLASYATSGRIEGRIMLNVFLCMCAVHLTLPSMEQLLGACVPVVPTTLQSSIFNVQHPAIIIKTYIYTHTLSHTTATRATKPQVIHTVDLLRDIGEERSFIGNPIITQGCGGFFIDTKYRQNIQPKSSFVTFQASPYW